MRFKGVQWHHNPREIAFECEKHINELHAPFGRSYVQDTGRRNRLIKGEGELYGADCREQFARLYELFRSGGSGVLAIPKLGTVYAVFERLTLKGMPKSDVLTYGFLFREVMEREKQDKRTVCTAQPGDTLWEISYRYGVGIDALVALNPQIKRPDEPLDGKEVALC
jgi:hypothetical protein